MSATLEGKIDALLELKSGDTTRVEEVTKKRKEDLLKVEKKNVEIMVLLFANAPTVSPKMIDEGIEILRADKSADSAVSTSVYNMWSP